MNDTNSNFCVIFFAEISTNMSNKTQTQRMRMSTEFRLVSKIASTKQLGAQMMGIEQLSAQNTQDKNNSVLKTAQDKKFSAHCGRQSV